MIDLLFVGITIVFLLVSIAFTYGCEALMGGSR
jgi:hypothetical protein